MQKIIFLLFFFLLNGCSFNSLFVGGEVDKVTVVRHTSYMKHHRAYFERTQLKIIRNGNKYLYLYNAKTNDVGVLLHRNNQYLLYNMSRPEQQPFTLNATSKTKYWHALKSLKYTGFRAVRSLASVGISASVSRQRYKGIKTLLIEIEDYSRLQNRYEKAIQTYNASSIRYINTKLPKNLISAYYTRYVKRAKTREQLLQLKIIASKLDLQSPKIPELPVNKQTTVPQKQKPVEVQKEKVEAQIQQEPEEEIKQAPSEAEESPVIQKTLPLKPKSEKPYKYYLKHASLNELSAYIANKATRNSLSYTRYNKLRKRKVTLQEERLFKEGSLEELIAAYKVNKNPKYKRRIMSLIKEKQNNP